MLQGKRPAAAAIGVGAALVMVAGGTTACGTGDESANPGFQGCQADPVTCNSGERADGGEITWGLDGSWTGWNPNTSAEYTSYTLQITAPYWPTVGHFDQNGEFALNRGLFAEEPRLVNENPMQVEYALEPGANWGDGTAIGVDDFIYNWYARSGSEALCQACTPAAATAAQIASIEEGSAADKIIVTYDDDYSSSEWKYEPILSNPAHIAEAAGYDWKDDPAAMGEAEAHFSKTVPTWSAGPFEVTDAETGDYAVYEPNGDWTGTTEVTLDKVTLRSFDSVDSIITELRQGTIDGANPTSISAENVAQLAAEQEIAFNIAPGPGWGHIDLNTKNEFLSDRALRTAVFQSIDVEELIARTYANVQSDASRKLNHLFRNDDPDFEDHLTATGQGAGDTGLAMSTLEEADYSWDGEGMLLDPEGEKVTLNYRYAEGSDDRQTMADLIAFNLADIGIDVELKPFPVTELGPTLAASDFDIINYGWTSQPVIVSSANQWWGSDSSTNFGQNEDPELDALLASLGSERDPDKAADIANEAVARVIADAYVLPTVDTPVAIMVSEDLVNVRDNWASQQRALYNIAEWGLRAD
ncbi:ABC transporter substrate-binding protein [Glycomyces harbinensis]|uniref:Peptide/nickel transport system substrate-binding protein n=1 Tax=Glycomyces harbinensis TaxID=58114 RepID=A0A1G6Z8A6_9ACTN|nr:ABC transporter substrate-binding protein [Glycomyces harbinensis]SDD98868.1 peptide/nickel transport system substrate-binding protein [Glycomyces harbinensis]